MAAELMPDPVALRLAVAALGGLAIGVEREWSAKARGRHHDFAGVRTFTLIGLAGGLAGDLSLRGLMPLAVAIVVALGALVLAAYVFAARAGDLDGTTEVAAILAVGGGVMAGLDQVQLSSGLFAVTALLLVEKGRLHGLVERLRSEEIAAAFRFAVLALVVLPLLPSGPYGPPPGIEPRQLWALVLLFSGLSFAGYVALRAAGPKRGYVLAGLLGGVVSSTAVTWSFSRESKELASGGGVANNGDRSAALGFGVVAACTALCVRVPLLAAVINAEVGGRLALRMVLPLLVGVAIVGRELRNATRRESDAAGAVKEVEAGRPAGGEAPASGPVPPEQPLRLIPAIQMTVLFLVVLYAIHWLGVLFGSTGIYGSAVLLGLTDMDALTYSLAKAGGASATYEVVARGITIGVIANTLFKLAITLAIGRGRFRSIAGKGLVALALAAVVGLAW